MRLSCLAIALLTIALPTHGFAAEVACDSANELSQRLAPFAKGDLAALVNLVKPRPVPDLSFTGPDGNPSRLDELKGKLLLVNLWATWCVPCREEMPALDKLEGEFGGPNF